VSAPAPPAAPRKKSRLSSVLRRTVVGGLLAAVLAALLWLAQRSTDGLIVLVAGAVLSTLAAFEVARMGRLAGRGLAWSSLLACLWVAYMVFALVRAYANPASVTSRFELPALVALYAVPVAVAALVFLELEHTARRLPVISLLLLALPVLSVVLYSFGVGTEEPAISYPLGWRVPVLAWLPAAGLTGLILALRRKGGAARPSPWPHIGLAVWIAIPLPALVFVWLNYDFGGLLALILLSKVGDIAGYYVGNAVGRHHPFPNLSKGKTTEGCVGSLLAGTLAGGLFVQLGWLPDAPFGWLGGLAAGLAINLAAQAGDLLESAVKRRAEVKDSGTWFGPSGGVLDLVDSLLLTVPTALVVWPLIFS